MTETPPPPQTDYPYAARTQVGPPFEEPAAPPPFVPRWLEQLESFVIGDPYPYFARADDQTLEKKRSRSVVPAVLFMIFGFALMNVLPLVIMTSNRPPGNLLGILMLAPFGGIMAAEFLIFAAALVWMRGHIFWRLTFHWMFALILYGVWAAALFIASLFDYRFNSADVVARNVLLALPAVGLATQLPLWCLRIYGAWRLEQDDTSNLPASSPLLISDMLIGTAVVAASLAAWRAIDRDTVELTQYWIAWSIGLSALAFTSILIVAPLLRLLLGWQSPWLAALGVCAYWALLHLLFLGIVLCFPPNDWREVTLLFSLTTLTGFLTISIFLLLLRSAGYRLRIGK